MLVEETFIGERDFDDPLATGVIFEPETIEELEFVKKLIQRFKDNNTQISDVVEYFTYYK